MLYLEHKRNRLILMTISILVTAVMAALLIKGINAVGVLMISAPKQQWKTGKKADISKSEK